MLISETMETKLNEQIKIELDSEHKYRAYAASFDRMGLKGFAEWFYGHADEERSHAMKLVKYLSDVGATVRFSAIDAPDNDQTDVLKIAKATLEHELFVTRKINEIVALADEEKDYATRSFINWFVDEQVEEVQVVSDMLQLIKLAGKEHVLVIEKRLKDLG